jgi:hypothetical protein
MQEQGRSTKSRPGICAHCKEKKCIQKVIFGRISVAFACLAGTGSMGRCEVTATRNGRASLVQLQRGAAKLFFLFEGKDMQLDGLICLLIGWLQEPITDCFLHMSSTF